MKLSSLAATELVNLAYEINSSIQDCGFVFQVKRASVGTRGSHSYVVEFMWLDEGDQEATGQRTHRENRKDNQRPTHSFSSCSAEQSDERRNFLSRIPGGFIDAHECIDSWRMVSVNISIKLALLHRCQLNL